MSQGTLRGTLRVPPRVPPHAKTYHPNPTQTAVELVGEGGIGTGLAGKLLLLGLRRAAISSELLLLWLSPRNLFHGVEIAEDASWSISSTALRGQRLK